MLKMLKALPKMWSTLDGYIRSYKTRLVYLLSCILSYYYKCLSNNGKVLNTDLNSPVLSVIKFIGTKSKCLSRNVKLKISVHVLKSIYWKVTIASYY